MFSLTQLLISSLSGAVVSLVVVWLYGQLARHRAVGRVDTVLIATVVGVSILLWRGAGNAATLNDDAIPLVSPNDVLCPMVTYVCLGLLSGFRATLQGTDWSRLRALLTIVSLVVNVVTI